MAMTVDVDNELPIHALDIAQLPANWREYPAPDLLGRLGGEWLAGSLTAILEVPSVVIPHERNYLLNPEHADFRRVVIGSPKPFSFDPRMWAKRRLQ